MLIKNILISLLLITSLQAQDFTGIRIYINPGHGGHDPGNDRFIPETGFWESEGNLTKGLHLKAILDELGATTEISRTQNRDSDDLGLSVISARANAFDADYFQSIHSNATGISSKRNTTLILFRGYDNGPVFPKAKEMSSLLANEIYKAHRTTNKYIRGDWDFYDWGTSGLGVLRALTMPGALSEGSFHDYIPESFRLKNDAYLKHESWAMTKAFIDYFNLSTLPYGEIAGILRDPFDTVNYFSLNSNDGKKPINYVKATLMPGNIEYNGDDFNNGFFMFDKVPTGTYDIILEAEYYVKDTINAVIVTAGKTTFADRLLAPAPNYSVPVVANFEPSSIEDIRLDSDIILEFNVKMNRASVEQSFSLFPSVQGSYRWELNDKKMIFSPNENLAGGSTYKINLGVFAKSAYDVFIDEPFTYSFSTRSSLSLLDAYPGQNQIDISTTVKFIYTFDAPINDFSLGGQIFFQDMNSNNVSIFIDEVDYQNGRIIFEPQQPLANNTNYLVKLLKGIKDTEGSNLSSDTTIIFTTESELIKEGSSLNDLEEIGAWWQPDQSGSTTGINTSLTSFAISNKKHISGENSGKLQYSFSSDSNGVCSINNEDGIDISTNVNNKFGIWVFGDYSKNILEFWFRSDDGTNIPIKVDTINWSGWKFKEIDLSSYSGLKFHSIVILQNKLGVKSGRIYFDAIQSNIITDVDEISTSIPNSYNLGQNYPNPFNPSTTIQYSIPELKKGQVATQIIVFDILGRQVSVLVNEIKKPGNYQITFNASSLSSGVYYYQINAGDYTATKKMLLLK